MRSCEVDTREGDWDWTEGGSDSGGGREKDWTVENISLKDGSSSRGSPEAGVGGSGGRVAAPELHTAESRERERLLLDFCKKRSTAEVLTEGRVVLVSPSSEDRLSLLALSIEDDDSSPSSSESSH